ncbi:RNA-dependent RNA polymerase [Fitzroy Crossing qinvirus 1]|nr:RNA-dependent RNA polymerase [Fitzroy Crossing qinvirus 1]
MARVFMPPGYKERDAFLTRLADPEFRKACSDVVDTKAFMKKAWLYNDIEHEAYVHTASRKSRWLEFHVKCSDLLLEEHGVDLLGNAMPYYSDYEAMMRLWHRVLVRGLVYPSRDYCTKAMHAGSRLALIGLAASNASPAIAVDKMEDFDGTWLRRKTGRLTSSVLNLCDALRLGVSVGRASGHMHSWIQFRDPMFMPSALRINESYLSKCLGCSSSYQMGIYTVLIFDDEAYIMSRRTRDMLADVLWSHCMWKIIAASLLEGDDYARVSQLWRYVERSVDVRIMSKKSTESLAKQMKASYAVALAMLKDPKVVDGQAYEALREWQVAALKQAADDLCEGENAFYHTLLQCSEVLQVNYGTIWNVLPAPDCDPQLLNDAIKEKYNAPRDVDKASWDDFLEYSKSVITAHYLLDARATPGLGDVIMSDGQPVSSHEWAVSCLNGSLAYPPDDARCWVQGVMTWKQCMDTWHLSADDVTHVAADSGLHTEDSCAVMKELTYAITNGSRFSTGHRPDEVRAMWEAGSIPGDRILYAAAKSENTKYGSNIRETMSGDDVMRACLSEIDSNASSIARFLDGIAMRAGKDGIEREVSSIMAGGRGADGQILLSLDVSGWSPNMVREGQMAFVDMLMSFFDIPEKMRASVVFRDLTVVMSRGTFFDKWMAEDGSIQGFFGTSDTIMHSLLAQWAFRNLKRDGLIAKRTHVDKVALIDDIVYAFRNCNVDPMTLIEAVSAQYARLGFTADVVKTIASRTHCNFLNRVYSKDGELLTYVKIAAKADREWERPWVSFHEEIDSAFGSMSGAVERGLPVWLGYFLVCWRICWRAMFLNTGNVEFSGLLYFAGAWLPRCMGGWGIPSASQWITKSTTDAIECGLSVLNMISRVYATTALSEHIEAYMADISRIKLDQRSEWTAISSPEMVNATPCRDPKWHVRKMVRKSIRKHPICAEFRSLMGVGEDDTYRELVMSAFRSCPYPLEIVKETMSSLPHTALDSIEEKLLSSEWASYRSPIHERRTAKKAFQRENIRALLAPLTAMEVDTALPAEKMPSAPELASLLRMRQAVCDANQFVVRNLTRAHASDVISYTDGEGPIVAHVPRFEGDMPGGLRTVFRTPGLEVVDSERVRTPCIVSRSFARMSKVVAMCQVCGWDGSRLKAMWERAWAGSNPPLAWPQPVCANMNIARALQGSNLKTFQCAANANISSAIRVRMTDYLRLTEDMTVTIPHMAVYTAIVAFNVIDVELGSLARRPGAVTRKYTVLAVPGFIAEHCGPGGYDDDGYDPPPYDGTFERWPPSLRRLTVDVDFAPGDQLDEGGDEIGLMPLLPPTIRSRYTDAQAALSMVRTVQVSRLTTQSHATSLNSVTVSRGTDVTSVGAKKGGRGPDDWVNNIIDALWRKAPERVVTMVDEGSISAVIERRREAKEEARAKHTQPPPPMTYDEWEKMSGDEGWARRGADIANAISLKWPCPGPFTDIHSALVSRDPMRFVTAIFELARRCKHTRGELGSPQARAVKASQYRANAHNAAIQGRVTAVPFWSTMANIFTMLSMTTSSSTVAAITCIIHGCCSTVEAYTKRVVPRVGEILNAPKLSADAVERVVTVTTAGGTAIAISESLDQISKICARMERKKEFTFPAGWIHSVHRAGMKCYRWIVEDIALPEAARALVEGRVVALSGREDRKIEQMIDNIQLPAHIDLGKETMDEELQTKPMFPWLVEVAMRHCVFWELVEWDDDGKAMYQEFKEEYEAEAAAERANTDVA